MVDFGLSKDSLRNIVSLTGEFVGTTDTLTLTNKTVSAEDNIIRSTTPALGNILKDNGTKYIPLVKGTAGQPLKVNSGATDVEYGTLPVAGGGTGLATHNAGVIVSPGGTTALTTKANPTGAFLGDSDTQNVTGPKTFTNTTLKRRNPAGTFTLTEVHPAITADANTYLNKPYTYHIFKIGSTYYAMDKTGAEVSTGATLDVVMDAVLALVTQATGSLQFSVPGGGDIYIDGGNHTLGGSFNGWDVPSLCTVTLASNCFILVPQGYTGYAFRLTPLISNSSAGQKSRLCGGTVKEAGAFARLWTAVLVEDDTGTGIFDHTVENMTLANCNIGIHLKSTHVSGWINGNVFQNIMLSGPVIGILFDYAGNTPSLSNGAHRNIFISIEGQAGTATQYGFKDIHGIMNTFIDCKMWDMHVGAAPNVTANITANATKTRIYGGIMTSLNYTDLGLGTKVDDDITGYIHKAHSAGNTPVQTVGAVRMTGLGLQSPIISPSTLLGTEGAITLKQYNNTSFSINFQPFSDTTTQTMSWYDNGATARLFIQKNTTSSYIIASQKVSAAGVLLPIIFQMIDSTGVGTTESMRISATDATLKLTAGITDATNIPLGTTTGTKIGTATTQKLGFYNKTPIVQPSAITTPTADVTSLKTAVDAIRTALINLGLTA